MPNIIARVRSIAGASSTTPAQLRYFRSASASDIGIAGAPGGMSQRTVSPWPSASRTSTAAGNRPLSGRSSACRISIKAMNFCTSGSASAWSVNWGLPSAPKHSAAATQ